MKFEMRHMLAAAGFVAMIASGLAVAAPSHAADMAAVEKRQALMKQNGKDAKVVADYLKGQGSAADVAKAAESIVEDAKKIPELFPAGTSDKDMPGKTKALPVIWTDMAKFKANAKMLEEKAMALEAAAKSGDKAKIQAAFGDMGRNACGACHGQFREKSS